eukprot:NODE_32_length_3355_cov_67.228005_g30_i0.p1 GENE.NODE_32_length_3355_cov_67.228005_g30_i0~~NODE_32_length_3355_cov_67.228005_g30_i0.p1  ORF type:complete len:1028 (+),score=239.46 NODE_32_length_3355_cov_67.228005_g30_i0:62-3085(+)
METKMIALGVLQDLIKTRWKVLPGDQQQGIKTFTVNSIIELSTDPQQYQQNKPLVVKFNTTLVDVLKQEWPHAWPKFISDLVGSSRTSDSLCQNNMVILRLLSEEVFNFSKGAMTNARVKLLKDQMNSEFSEVFSLCLQVLKSAEVPSLLHETLHTLLRFLMWIPLGYIFETNLIDCLVGRFLPIPQFRNATLKCLTEIASLSPQSQYDECFVKLFHGVMMQLRELLPDSPKTSVVSKVVGLYEHGGDAEQFVANLGLFLSFFFTAHLAKVENHPHTQPLVIPAHMLLVAISNVNHKEIFKAGLEYWSLLCEDIYQGWKGFDDQWAMQPEAHARMDAAHKRKSAYEPIFTDLRRTMIKQMVRPEEVIIMEDDNGEYVKQEMPDVDAQQLYNSMKNVLVVLTHLDYDDTECIMLDKLNDHVEVGMDSLTSLNTLCWAVGSISGAMSPEAEKRFLVAVIKDLLTLCERVRGKQNKAVIASNIMYVVGQYPQFMRQHWRFLQTVIRKLFEFMHETFTGIKDMAVDTFLKICKQTADQFIIVQSGEQRPYADDILMDHAAITSDLETPQIQVFYEALGHIIAAADPSVQPQLVGRLMEHPNRAWDTILSQATQDVSVLGQLHVMQHLAHVLKVNVRAARSVGPGYSQQLMQMFGQLMTLFKLYSQHITDEVARNGERISGAQHVRAMRIVKRDVLRLMQEFVDKSGDMQYITQNFIPLLLDTMLSDYRDSVDGARDAQVLALLSVVVEKLGAQMMPHVGRILECTLECTLKMITRNYTDYPDHRRQFFKLIHTLSSRCFEAFLQAMQQSKVVLDTIVWAVKHAQSELTETGLTILLEFLENVRRSPVASHFYQAYLLGLLGDMFGVLTDTFHLAGFKLQCQVLAHLLLVVVTPGIVTQPLRPNEQDGMDNPTFLRHYLLQFLSQGFGQLQRPQMEGFVNALFERCGDLKQFKQCVSDFLVLVKEQGGTEIQPPTEAERHAQVQQNRQQAIPGICMPDAPRSDNPTDEAMLS